MYKCVSCQSSNLTRRGQFFNKSENVNKQRYQCKDCETQFSVELPKIEEEHKLYSNKNNKKYVITSYQGGEYNLGFLNVLENYCEYNDAELIILHSPNKSDNSERISELDRYIVSDNFDINKYITVYSQLNISKTAESPLSGLESLSKGKSLIVGHSSLEFKMLPSFGNSHPLMMTSTGSISIPDYKLTTKAGAKADHNHSYSAIVLELDNQLDIYHFRVLNAEDDGNFYDLDKYYTKTQVLENQRIDALILGDEHWGEHDENVYRATYLNEDSIVKTLKPRTLVRHDALSFNQASGHHSRNSFLTRFRMNHNGDNDVFKELLNTTNYIKETTFDFVENNILVDSNHHSHLTRWLSESNTTYDYSNALIFHFLMYHTLNNIVTGGSVDVSPFELFYRNYVKDEIVNSKTKFLGDNDSYLIHGIECGLHGHVSINGGAGSPTSFGNRWPVKVITAHTHTPSIKKGAYCVGTSSKLKLSYTSGGSTWLQGHCCIHENGKRQLIFIIKGKYKL